MFDGLLQTDLWVAALWLAGLAAMGYLFCVLGLRIVVWFSRRAESQLGDWLAGHLRPPLRLLIPVLVLRAAAPYFPLPSEDWTAVLTHATAILLIIATGWLLVAATGVLQELLDVRYVLTESDNLRARRIHTKFRVLRRVLVIVVGFFTFAAVLLTFPGARSIGAGIFASAGIAGIALGIAARPTLETLLAGVQLALTEPINLDDVVIVEGEWGRIEEIRATYVVVCIWDQRRLVVPIQYFISQPFQNWTRVSADLLGIVTVDVDYTAPVDAIRSAVKGIVEDSSIWNREFWNLQVVDAGPSTMRLRVLVSAGDSGNAWDLRCEIREKLIAWLQAHHPAALPRLRAERVGEAHAQPT